MNELALSREIVTMVADRVGDARVSKVVVEVGALVSVSPDALEFAFDLASEGTVLEGASLEVVSVPARARCLECGAEVKVSGPAEVCSCGSFELDPLGGTELNVRDVELV